MKTDAPLPDARFFTNEAMRTVFSLRFPDVDEIQARGIARLCFEQIDLLESRLNRHLEGSEIWRINHMEAGETLYLSDACHRCLLLALEAGARTGGLFDITLGKRIEHAKSGSAGELPPLAGRLSLHPDVVAITCEEPGRELDLGGIGKGFALDELRALLDEWSVNDALVAAGASSMLAVGSRGWPVDLIGDRSTHRVVLKNQALSASGTGIQGSHIVRPEGLGDECEDLPCKRVWVMAESAALAEVWSTALMMVAPEWIEEMIAGEGGLTAVYVEKDGEIFAIRHSDACG